ncbi:MAG: gamma-glutamyl-gamma-aminobutyrate hydrolase family protein [Alphaproteobacteria bacterium GM7ARS4]|nr:gamma-glutamyl-gamma-aminobutyrate hydrolase family protein [Alphaproteobacteria bacterium GM7ARS4]
MKEKRTKQPLIGVTMDGETTPSPPTKPFYMVRHNYCACLAECGAVPVMMPYGMAHVQAYASLLDGLLVTGGDFDIEPTLYTTSCRHPSVQTHPLRTRFEYALVRAMRERSKSVFGICGGMQLLNVVGGGTLIQHIPDAVETAIAHEQPNPRDEVGHRVFLESQSVLRTWVGKDRMDVNSAHHQAVEHVAPGMCISARADDGIIEAIEDEDRQKRGFCFAVQWHPEYRVDDKDMLLFKEFVAHVSSYAPYAPYTPRR